MTVQAQSIVYFAILMLAALAVGFVFSRSAYEWQGTLLVALGIGAVGYYLINRMARPEAARWFLAFLAFALVARLGMALVRMYTSIWLYGGLYDAGRYFRAGGQIAQNLWSGEFVAVSSHLRWGTKFTEFYAGLVQAMIGPTIAGSYLVFGLLSFIGAYYFYLTFRTVFPYGNRLFYGALVFFYPSIMYWPNGIGKDALMTLFIGMISYGGALLLIKGRLGGLMPLGLGLYGAITVRPHMAAMMAIALVGAFMMRKSGSQGSLLLQGLLLVVGVAFVWFMMPSVMSYVGIDEVSFAATQDYIVHRQGISLGGGSAFQPPSLTHPLFIPMAAATLLFRPFPWEAHNVQALMQAFDGMLLMGLMVWRLPNMLRAFWGSDSRPYAIYILAFFLMSATAFMIISNFGTLVRERAMILPLLLMLVAYNPPPKPGAPEPAQTTSNPEVDQIQAPLIRSNR